MDIHTIDLCPACGVRRVPGASACWQCGGTFTPAPTAPAAPRRWGNVAWAGVIPFGLFFLPWVIAGPYWTHRVISVAGLELALGRTLRGRSIPQDPLLWLIPVASLLLAALLFRARWRTPGLQHWLRVATVAWAGFALLLIKAVLWLLAGPSPGTGWVVHWLTTEYLVSVAAFLVSALSATRAWMGQRGPHTLSSSSPSHDTPFDEEQLQ